MKPDLGEVPRLCGDTSLFCRFEETLGWMGLYALLNYFGPRLVIVVEVARELDGHSRGGFPQLAMLKNTQLKGEYLHAQPEQLPSALALQVGQIARSWPDADPARPRKNFGEVASVLLAQTAGYSAILDDGPGQRFARRRNVPCYTTRDVTVAMAASGALSEDDAAAIWASVFRHQSDRHHFEAALAQLRAARGT